MNSDEFFEDEWMSKRHIYAWLDRNEKTSDPVTRKVWLFFEYHTKSAMFKSRNRDLLGDLKILCEFEDSQYRITGASRLGDIYLASNLERTVGYDLRVPLDRCKKFSIFENGELSLTSTPSTEGLR
jgi:hypothetical protein